MLKKYLKHALIILGLLIVLGAITLWFLTRPDVARLSEDDVTGSIPKLGEVRPASIPTMEVAPVVGWQGGAKPTPAKGLKVVAFAGGLDHPRWLYRLPNGDILVAETNSPPRKVGGITGMVMGSLMKKAGAGSPSANRITLLRDTNNDGVADQKTVFLTGLNSPYGMALMGDYLYVGNTDALVRYPYKTGDTSITAKPEKIIDLAGGGNHWARNVIVAPGGKSLYVAVGSSSNIAENGLDAEGAIYTGKGGSKGARAAILEVYPDTKTARVFGYGLRNPNGMAIEPHSGVLWTVVNERDMLGSDMPPDYLARVDLGTFFGWPWNYWGGYVDKRVQPERPDLVQYSKRPEFALGPHVAPLGLVFASDAKLGPNFADGAFIGLHGSWNREPLSGYKVVYVPFGADGFPAKGAKPVPLLTGFLDDKGNARGRPVGVITDAGGGLLVADDVGNIIWRVTAQ